MILYRIRTQRGGEFVGDSDGPTLYHSRVAALEDVERLQESTPSKYGRLIVERSPEVTRELLVRELREAVRVLDQIRQAHADPEPVGDFDPMRAAVVRAGIVRAGIVRLVAAAGGGRP